MFLKINEERSVGGEAARILHTIHYGIFTTIQTHINIEIKLKINACQPMKKYLYEMQPDIMFSIF